MTREGAPGGATNGPDRFGWVSRALHWTMAAGVLGMLVFGTYLGRLTPSLSTLWMYAWHKSFGLTLLTLLMLRLLWHGMTPPPRPLSGGIAAWQMRLARAVHWGLYLLMAAVPLSGWIGSAATGIEVQAFGWTLPAIVPPSEQIEAWGMGLHRLFTYALMGLVALHLAGVADRQLLRRDATLRRMIRGR